MGNAKKIKRMHDLKRRTEMRRRKRRLTNLIIFAVIAVLLIIIFVSCGGEKDEIITETVEIKTQPSATSEVSNESSSQTYEDFYQNSVFVGNSFIDGMEIYEFFDDADYFAKVGLSVNDAMTESTDNGTVPVIDELDSQKQYDKVFMMFGENEVGWPSSQTFVNQYAKLIEKAKKYQPDAEIYLLSITPISEKASEEALDGATNENIVKFNKLIKGLAEEEEVTYCDIYKAVVDSNGALPAEAASDGVHFTKKYYEKCLEYIYDKYGNGKIPEESESEENTTPVRNNPRDRSKTDDSDKTVTTPKPTVSPTPSAKK